MIDLVIDTHGPDYSTFNGASIGLPNFNSTVAKFTNNGLEPGG